MLSLQLKIFPILTSIFRTFLNNMKAFGLGNDICKEFLHKMSTIGDLSEEQIKLLEDSMAAADVDERTR